MTVHMYICPECVQGKHGNCDGTAWDDKNDCRTACNCATNGHGAVRRSVLDMMTR